MKQRCKRCEELNEYLRGEDLATEIKLSIDGLQTHKISRRRDERHRWGWK
jgi:phage FluMu protein Com